MVYDFIVAYRLSCDWGVVDRVPTLADHPFKRRPCALALFIVLLPPLSNFQINGCVADNVLAARARHTAYNLIITILLVCFAYILSFFAKVEKAIMPF